MLLVCILTFALGGCPEGGDTATFNAGGPRAADGTPLGDFAYAPNTPGAPAGGRSPLPGLGDFPSVDGSGLPGFYVGGPGGEDVGGVPDAPGTPVEAPPAPAPEPGPTAPGDGGDATPAADEPVTEVPPGSEPTPTPEPAPIPEPEPAPAPQPAPETQPPVEEPPPPPPEPEPTVQLWAGDVTIVYPAGIGWRERWQRDAATLMRSYLSAALPGQQVALSTSPVAGTYNIGVGQPGWVNADVLAGLDLATLGRDGFTIHPISDESCVILGTHPYGVEFGVYHYLEQLVGVHWLYPGPDGEDVPLLSDFPTPIETIREVPAFKTRHLTEFTGRPDLQFWARCNRMEQVTRSEHGMYWHFPPSKYAATHPEFYAIAPPASDSQLDWQLNFAAAGLVDAAVDEMLYWFSSRGMSTVSLGINDSKKFEPAQLSTELNFLGQQQVSNHYYPWVNDVVNATLAQLAMTDDPNRYSFSILAYNNAAEPPTDPTFRLHPQVTCWVLYDINFWAEEAGRDHLQQWTVRWLNRAARVGWSDYQWGSPFCAPRLYPEMTAEALRWAYSQGVEEYKTEFYPMWGEGPKGWVLLQLLWDPQADPDALMAEWCERAVGPAAAEDLLAYYAFWESFWTQAVVGGSWWKGDSGHYVSHVLPGYLDHLSDDDVATLRVLMDGVVAKADTPVRQRRAAMLARFWDYYEATALAYRAKFAYEVYPTGSEAEALLALDDAVSRLVYAEERHVILAELAADPATAHFVDLDDGFMQWLRGDDWGVENFWRLYDWALQSQAVVDAIEALQTHPGSRVAYEAQKMFTLLQAASPGTLVSIDESFEVDGTWFEYRPGGTQIDVVTAPVLSGSRAMRFFGVSSANEACEVGQTLYLPPGNYILVANAQASAPLGPNDEALLKFFVDDVRYARWFKPAVGAWTETVYPFTIADHGQTSSEVAIVVGSRTTAAAIYFDDVGLYRLFD